MLCLIFTYREKRPDMIPILYEKNETAFTSNGLARLIDCSEAKVTEERNGQYECQFTYPITGRHFEEIQRGRIIGCTHDEQGDIQPFIIYHNTEPIEGQVTFYAHHISYRLNKIAVKPYTAQSCPIALQKILSESINENPFTFWTDKSTVGEQKVEIPKNARNILGGEEGSILDVYGGGEYEFDKFSVKLYARRGTDTDVQIRYGKNLSEFNNDTNETDVYNAIIPYWFGNDSNTESTILVALPEWIISSSESVYTDLTYAVPLDMTSEFQEKPSIADLRVAATAWLASSDAWLPAQTIKISFVQLWQTEEYADVAPLERVRLCDTVEVIHPRYNLSARVKVVKVVYDVLLDRYESMELGEPSATLGATIAKSMDAVTRAEMRKSNADMQGAMQQAIDAATALITGANGGYVVINYNANGKPIEILVTDNEDLEQAVNVWRWNMNGIGYSSTGYNGTYTTAWTIDGAFNADFITTGHLAAALITGLSGQLSLEDDDIILTGNRISINATKFQLAPDGTVTMKNCSIQQSASSGAFLEINANQIVGGYRNTSANGEGYIDFANRYGGVQWTSIGDDKQVGVRTPIFYVGRDTGNAFYPMATFNNAGYQSSGVYGTLTINGNFKVNYGSKSKIADAGEYGERLLYCYETPTPMFGDIGEGVIGDDGKVFMPLDAVFANVVNLNQYQVFLQKYGQGDAFVTERAASHFVVEGTPGLEFGFELKAKQNGFDQLRLDRNIEYLETMNEFNYIEDAERHLTQIAIERGLA